MIATFSMCLYSAWKSLTRTRTIFKECNGVICKGISVSVVCQCPY